MSQEQIALQRKTKIAAWFLTVVGAAATILGIALILLNPSSGYSEDHISAPVAYTIFILALSLPGVLNIVAGVMLFKGKPRARKLSMVLLSMECILFVIAAIATAVFDSPAIAFPFVIALVLYIIPLILLLLDRDKTITKAS